MRPDALVIRHRENGAPAAVAAIMDCPVINAGDGTNEHPTQALLDAATHPPAFRPDRGPQGRDLRRHRAQPGRALQRQAAAAARRRSAPRRPAGADARRISAGCPIDEAIAGADVVMMLRVQRERLEEDLGDAPGEYLDALRPDRASGWPRAAPDARRDAPGPDEPRRRDRERDRRRSRTLADHASGRDGRRRPHGLPGAAARRRLSARRSGPARRRRAADEAAAAAAS